MFSVALQNLKYMGLISATRSSTFVFRKNFFGKPSKDVGQVQQSGKEIQRENEQMFNVLSSLNQ
jgi:hypothetical protein